MKLTTLKKKYKKNRKKFKAFIRELHQSDLSDVLPIAQQAEIDTWQKINCLECANCCKKMTPTLDVQDMERISGHLQLTPTQFRKKYLLYDRAEKDWRMQVQPCVFLEEQTNKCTIYEVRPNDCRSFPHLTKTPLEDFVYIHEQNIKYCPASYTWVKLMHQQIEFSE